MVHRPTGDQDRLRGRFIGLLHKLPESNPIRRIHFLDSAKEIDRTVASTHPVDRGRDRGDPAIRVSPAPGFCSLIYTHQMEFHMLSKSSISAGLALLLALILTIPVFSGGWAVITLDELPTDVVAGEPLTIGFTVRQHGIRPMDGLDPTVT